VLQNNATQSLPVNTSGSFTFSTSVASGTPYNITISMQPTNPAQTCGATNVRGTVNAKVNVQVNCGHGKWAFTNLFWSGVAALLISGLVFLVSIIAILVRKHKNAAFA
jgi:hypothetical protein